MKKRKLCMIFLLCLALMTLVAGCRSKKETNDQGNQKGTAIYYTNNDVTKLIIILFGITERILSLFGVC